MIDIAIVRRSGGVGRVVSPWVLLDRLRTLSRGPFCINGRSAVARWPFGPWRAGRGDGVEKLRAL